MRIYQGWNPRVNKFMGPFRPRSKPILLLPRPKQENHFMDLPPESLRKFRKAGKPGCGNAKEKIASRKFTPHLDRNSEIEIAWTAWQKYILHPISKRGTFSYSGSRLVW
jgi:hypothetical protein